MTSIPMTTDYVDVKVKIGAVEFTNEELQIDSIKISNGCYDGSVFGIGNVYIKNANITMNYRDGITKGLSMEIFFEYQGAWISFGKFVVTETPAMSGDKISVSLESTLAQYANTEIVFAEAKPSYNFDTIIKKIEEITGKVVVFKSELDSTGTEKSEFLSKTANFIKDAKTLMDPASGCKTGISVRTALAGIAILFGGNVYEDTNNKIVIKQKTYSLNSDRYILPDYLDGNYKYSKEVYAIKTISLLFNKYVLDIYYRKETDPPGDDIWTQNYLDEDKVSNTLLASQSSMTGKTPYDYTVTCDWIGWTSDGFGYNLNETPGGRASACLRQGDLMYRTCDMTFVGIDFGWNIAPGNLIKVKVPELENPIDVLCGEISYEWDGGFTTSISCNCNIESNGSYSTEVSTQASAVAAQEGRKTSLELNYANITFSNIEDSTIRGSIFKDGTIDGSKIKDSTITGSLIADSTIKGSNIEEGTITGSKIKAATITGALIVDGTIRGNHIMESSIDGSKIKDSAITESKISNSSITNSKIKDGEIENSKIKDATLTGSKIENSTLTNDLFKDGTIENSKIKDGTIENSKIKDATLTGAKIKDATIGFEKVDTSFIEDLTADKAYIEKLKASIADIGYLTADEADIKYATIASLEAVDGKIDNLETIAITTNNISAKVADLGYLNADTADVAYAKIDFSNVVTQVVGSSMIIDGAVTNEKVANLSANKITSGEIDASKVTVSNLNASNINTGTLTVGGVTLNIKENKAEIDGSDIKDGTVTLEGLSKEVKDTIDGAIETFTKSEIPTPNNEPASLWTDNETRKKHIGDVCYVLNPASSADGYCYRFANTGTEESPSYEWVLIKDSDVTKALQDIIDINGDITGIKQFDKEISSWKTDTDDELSSLKSRTTTLETDIGSKVESSVFNELKQTVDENISSITSLSTTVSKKADSSTVTDLTNTVNSVKQTSDKNTSSISSMQTEIGKKADGSTVTELSQRTSNLEQNLNGFKTTVSKTYTTKTEFDNLEIGGRNLALDTGNLSRRMFGYINNVTFDTAEDNEVPSKQCLTVTMTSVNATSSGIYYGSNNYISKLKVGDEITVSFYAKCSQARRMVYTLEFCSKASEQWLTSEWKKFSLTGTVDHVTGSGLAVTFYSSYFEVGDVLYISSIKVERGNKATDWTPAPEDTEESITEVKTIAEQTADKFSWLVKSGTSATNFELTDRVASLLSEQFNIDALTTFKNSAENGTSTVINGGAIKAKTIKASSIDVDNLFAQDITATGTITGATLKGAKIYSEIGEIAGFTLKDQTLISEFTQTDISNSVWDFKNEINSKANSEKHFITATRTGHESGLIANKACFGIDGVLLNSFNKGDDYYDKFMHLSERILAFGVNSATPYNGRSIAFEIDSGYSAIYSSGEFTIEPSCTINVPTTIRDALRVESDPSDAEKSYVRINNHEVQLHAINSSVVFYLSAYSGSNNKFKLYSTNGNIVDVTDTTAMTITPKVTASNGIAEQGYDVVGCTVTTSGNFTCKKYRDGRLIVEYKKILTSKLPLSNTDWSGIHYAQAEYGYNYFPVGFTEAPSVTSGIAIADLTCPFCTLTIERITKSYFVRAIVWTIGNISGYELPVGTVISATFTGRWK